MVRLIPSIFVILGIESFFFLGGCQNSNPSSALSQNMKKTLSAASVAGQRPEIFFTDLTSAPNTGGENANGFDGAYITLYGNNLGSAQDSSTVTWNGLPCLRVVGPTGTYTGWGSSHLWYQKIVIQLSSACTPGAGNFVVTTSAGSSNGMPFTVRSLGANHIYFVAKGGNDNNPGTFAQPFATIPHCTGAGGGVSMERAGDVCYVEDGVNQTQNSGFAGLTLGDHIGTATLPLALLTYPGANSTVGSNSLDKGIVQCDGYIPQCLSSNGAGQYITMAGFHVRGASYAISIQGSHSRYVAMEVQCPSSGNGDDLGCFNTIENYQTLLGNEISNTGMDLAPGGTCGKLCHSLYIGYPPGENGHDFEIGWNSSHDVNGGRCVQFYNGSASAYNVNFHDNLLYNNVGVDGVTLDVDPDLGYVNVYNNVIYHVAQTPDEDGDATCMYLQSSSANPSTPVNVYNNTMYDCSHVNAPTYGMISANIPANFQNNLVYSTDPSIPYFSASFSLSNVSGSHNLWYGAGNGPSQTLDNVNADPLFANPSVFDLHLQGSSPAIDVGLTIPSLLVDHDGVLRPQGAGYDIGAYEYASDYVAPTPTPTATPNPTPNPSPSATPLPSPTPTPIDNQAPTTSIISPVDGAVVPMQTVIRTTPRLNESA